MCLITLVKLPSMHANYLFKTVGKDIVRLTNSAHNSGGTGFVVTAPSGKNYTLTNEHVCDLGKEYGKLDAIIDPENTLVETTRFISLRIIEKSKDTDLCILEALPNRRGVSLGSVPEVGDEIGIVGHPFLEPRTLTRGMVTSFSFIRIALDFNVDPQTCGERGGIVEELTSPFAILMGYHNVCLKEVYAGRSTALSFPGNSGSPVVNIYGNLVGVLFAGNNESHFSYIVPLQDIEEFLRLY